MTVPNYRRTRLACFSAYLSMSSVFVLPPMLFTTFRTMYGISFTLLGTLVVVNFCVQMLIDLVLTFFSKYFNIRLTIRIMPLLTSFGMILYAVLPTCFPQFAYGGLVLGTVIFSVAAGLSEVLLSPLVAAMPSENPEADMSLLHSLYGWGVVSMVLISSVYFWLFGTENWPFLMGFLALLPLISALLFFISPIPDMQLSANAGVKKHPGRAKGIALCAVCIFLGGASENVMTNWISGYMEIALQIPKQTGDILGLAVFALLLAATRSIYAKFTPDISKTLLCSTVGATVCYLFAGLSQNPILSFGACILMGMFTSMLWPGTLILLEEKVPMPGVMAYALMAACGDFGSSVAPQLLGIVADNIAVSSFAAGLSQSTGMLPEEIGLKTGMLVAAFFPLAAVFVVMYMRKWSKTMPRRTLQG